jgi:hypothetical protein
MLWAWEQLGSGLASGSGHFPWPAEPLLAGATTPQTTSSGCAASGSGSESAVLRRAVSKRRIIYRPREDATTESELHTLAQIYKFVLTKQRAAHPAAPNEAKGLQHGRPAQGILPK